ncbi:MAG: hypothetical protein RLZZ354_296 [Pseudomonadota bacterium]|jgi:hypothetical protein
MDNKKIKKPRKPRQNKKSKDRKSKNKNTQNIKINISSTGSGGGGTPSMPASTISKTSVVPLPIQAFSQAERTGENVQVDNLLKRLENQQQSAINELSGVMNTLVIPAITDRQQQLQLPQPSSEPMPIKRMGRPQGSKNKPKIPIVQPSPDTTGNTFAQNINEFNNVPDQIDEANITNVPDNIEEAFETNVSSTDIPIEIASGGGGGTPGKRKNRKTKN